MTQPLCGVVRPFPYCDPRDRKTSTKTRPKIPVSARIRVSLAANVKAGWCYVQPNVSQDIPSKNPARTVSGRVVSPCKKHSTAFTARNVWAIPASTRVAAASSFRYRSQPARVLFSLQCRVRPSSPGTGKETCTFTEVRHSKVVHVHDLAAPLCI